MKKALSLIRLRVARLWWVMIVISVIGTALGFAWYFFDFLDMSDDEMGAYDDGLKRFNNKWWFPWGQSKISDDIVLVAVDSTTFGAVDRFPDWKEHYGRWPYDRLVWKDVIEYVSGAGAKAVVLDLLITENQTDLKGDEWMAKAIANANCPVTTGFGVEPLVEPLAKVEKPVNRLVTVKPPPPAEPEQKEEELNEFPTEPTPEEQLKAKLEEAKKLRDAAAPALAFPVKYEGGLEGNKLEGAKGKGLADGGVASAADMQSDAGLVDIEVDRFPQPPIAQLVGSASGFGLVEPEADDDGKLRTTKFVYTDGINDYVTLSLATAADYWKADHITYAPGKLQIGSHEVRINKDGTARLNYGGRLSDRFRIVSLSDVLRYRIDKQLSEKEGKQRFKDKVVFIGVIASGVGDEKPTPFNSFEPGVVKHMVELDNLLNDAFILEAPIWASLVFALLVALFSVALVMVAQSFVTDVGAPILLTFAFFIITGGFITFTDVHILSAMPGMAGTLAALMATTYNRFLASKDREFLREAFASYVDEDVLDAMVEQRKLPSLEGEEREVTAFICDLKAFTQLTEDLKGEPRKVLRVLHEYLSTVTPLLKDEGACIDKYIADSVIAIFGAPAPVADHAMRACRAALAVQAAMDEVRKHLAQQGLPEVFARVGINTDTMLVGNMGSRSRPINYTAIGDHMTVSSRIERANKAYDTTIIIGPKTYEAVKAHFAIRELDHVRVEGHADVITLYELLGEEGSVSPAKRQVLDLYAKALELYRHKRFSESLRALKDAYDLDKSDGPTKVLAGKCNQFMQSAPPADWDGVTQL